MRIKLAYGKTGLSINLPDSWNVTAIEPTFVPALSEPSTALRRALQSPTQSHSLGERVRPNDKVGIIVSDITRPEPRDLILPAILGELTHVPRENITLFIALGTHRLNTDLELRRMLGDALVDNYRIVQNNAFDPNTQISLGVSTRGHEIWLNREVIESDIRILTGFIEPHFFAGFSGGGKAIMPGMAGQQTVLGNHDADMIGHPKATWGETRGNPIWEEIQEVAIKAAPTFLVNVTLNRDKQITGVFAGDLEAAHASGCEFVKYKAMVSVPQAFDIVVTTNSGYPLDLNLYQSVKGMSAGAQIIKEKGSIIIATECWDGIPNHGLYGQILREAASPRGLLDQIMAPGFLKQDQWQVQIQAQIQLKADIYVYSDHLGPEEIRRALLQPCAVIEETLTELRSKYGAGTRICVLPEGPQTIPYLKA